MLGGIDIGTTGCKITVYDQNGQYTYSDYQDYPVSRKTGEHEVYAQDILAGVTTLLRKAGTVCKDMKALGITSFGESFVLLDEKDEPLLPVMLYTDPRGKKQCEKIREKVGEERFVNVAGTKPDSTYSLAKILWIKEKNPDVFNKTKRICLMEDYVIYMLTGEACIDYSLAARTMAFSISELKWSQEILQKAQIEESLFSRPVRSGTIAGRLKKEMAQQWGFSECPLVVPVGHDQVAAAIGTGVFHKGGGVDGAGTVQCITPIFQGIPDTKVMAQGNYAIVPYVIPGKYVTYAYQYTGGALTNWYIKQMAKGEWEEAGKTGKSVYTVLEEKMQDAPTGILVLPHFAGAATPYMDTGSKGAILGLTLEHTTADVYRAFMEGVVYEMLLNMEYLDKAGIMPEKLWAAGGGAASKIWMQMKADVLNVPIVSLGNVEAGATGCVMMAGVAAGAFGSLEEAAKVMVKEKAVYEPRKAMREAYLPYYEKYKGVYKAVRGFM